MAKDERSAIQLDDQEGGHLNVIWSRSGKHLIVTVTQSAGFGQVELMPQQVEELISYLTETLAG